MINSSIKNSILSWMMRKRIHQIELFMKYPHDVQKDVLSNLIDIGKHTLFGKEHFFDSIESYADFVDRVPIRTYEELFPYIEQTRKGEESILWPTKVNWFAKSSGTTNAQSKYIPVSKESLEECYFKAGKDMLSFYCNNFPNTQIFDGKGLMLGGSLQKNGMYDFIEGDISAILIDNFPFWVNIHRTPDLKTALLDDWEEKLKRIINQGINSNVTSLTGVPSWMLVLLNKIIKKTGVDDITEIWPNLELYMHGGINFSPYRKQFEQLIPSKNMNYLEAYNASEGFFGIQDQSSSSDLLLMLDYGIFYEFIPLEKLKQGEQETITLAEVVLNKDYALVITTNAGLWRYLIGDVIRFSSTHPYRLKIVGRTKSFINAFGEELMVDNSNIAIKTACEKTKAEVTDYTVAPIYLSKDAGAHQWLIEFNKPADDITEFCKHLDTKLKELNSDYQAKRTDNLILKEPEIVILKSGSFYKWLSSKDRLGGQYKVPRLSNDRKLADEILALEN